MSLKDFTHGDDGTQNIPGTNSEWENWISATRTRNFLKDDPLLDWLNLWGGEKGFTSDTALPGYDERTDFLEFLFAKGRAFEEAVIATLRSRFQIVDIVEDSQEAREVAATQKTWDAMTSGAEMIFQSALWNPENQTYGLPDLLIRSDILNTLFPETLSADEASKSAPDIDGGPWHYRVVDVKFTTLDLLKDGHSGSSHKSYMAQVWLYNEALGRIQGYTPPSGFLLGRAWKQGKNRGSSALERLERVDHHYIFRSGDSLQHLTRQAVEWVRRVRSTGASWSVSPPSIPELRPNLRSSEDAPWHRAKAQIGEASKDLTKIYRVTADKRNSAIDQGIHEWTDPRCSASLFSIGGSYATFVDAILAANQSSESDGIVFPKKVTASEELWRKPVTAEFYVDFETVSDLDDDFTNFPNKGGTPMIFMIGMGWLADRSDPSSWQFKVFTTDRLDQSEEKRIITEWIAELEKACSERDSNLKDARIYHWSPAETSTLSTAYNAASRRHGLPEWNSLPWVDLLKHVIKAQPVTAKGAWGFGLKAVSKALHRAGFIQTDWDDGPMDGLGAMVGAWWCEAEAKTVGTTLPQLEFMQEIERYNEVDCRVMAEILHFLRHAR